MFEAPQCCTNTSPFVEILKAKISGMATSVWLINPQHVFHADLKERIVWWLHFCDRLYSVLASFPAVPDPGVPLIKRLSP